MKVLITGSGGFIGRNLVEAWQERYMIEAPRSRELNLLNADRVKQYLKEKKFDVVIHSAKIDEVYRPNISQQEILDGNLRMFYNLERCREYYGKMIYFGSGAEYDRKNMPPMVKESDFGKNIPVDAYGFSKYVMGRMAECSENIYDLRLFGVFGKYEDCTRRFISNNICRSLKGKPITLNQNARFDYLYIEDLCQIVSWFVERTPRYHAYNVCTGKPVELTELAQLINDVTGLDRPIIIKEKGFQKDYTGECYRLLQEISDLNLHNNMTAINKLYTYYMSDNERL